MTVLKTAISLDADLFRRAELLARVRKVSRSQLVAEALEKYIAEQEDEMILMQLNRVYEEGVTPVELDDLVAVYRADAAE